MINNETLKELKAQMAQLDAINSQIKEKKAAFEESIKEEKEVAESIKQDIESLKKYLTIEGLNEFAVTNDKQLTGGLAIRETTVLKYSQERAFEWAKEHKMCLSLDKKAFESVAKSTGIDFVFINKEPKVTFPKEIKVD